MAADALASIDWNAIDAMSNEDIARQIAENPDAAPDLRPSRAKLVYTVAGGRLAFRHKVKIVRKALRLSQAEFAEAYHLNLRTLQNWERSEEHTSELQSLM